MGRREKAAGQLSAGAGLRSQLSHDVCLLNKHNLAEHQLQARSLCDQDGERQKQVHSIISVKHKNKQLLQPENSPSYRQSLLPFLRTLQQN